jgi:RNA polymerase sigma-70 factor (ECF subfamily)
MTPDPSLDTARLQAHLERLRAGDREAADALLRQVCGRLERPARSMLRSFPNVRRWADTDDVLQSALLRLLRTLQALRPESTRDFTNLAAVHIRRELLDLARGFQNRLGRAVPMGEEELDAIPDRDSADGELDLWAGFHEEVERLPVLEREVVGLTYYHGWTQPQIAELLQVDERTVRRHWRSACRKLSAALGGRLPQA